MDTSRAQQRELSALLHHAWAQSSFYREYYSDHGIRQEDLAHVTVRDLPFLTKPILMDHFDAAVTDRRLRKRELERWFAEHRDPRDLFHEDLIAVTSSGTSGTWGFFVYDRPAWRTVNASASTRLPAPEPGLSGKTRVAFYVSTFGHGTSITTSRYLTPALHDVLLLSMLDPPAQVVERLEAFQPDRLVGYSSAVATLAEWALAGRLRIAPRWVVVGSDRLSESMERTIAAAWGTKPYLLYVASESLYIGIRGPGEPEITMLDDLNIVEILDAEHREVGAGESGRVVLTNLYTYALPVIRYELGDEVVRGAVAARGVKVLHAARSPNACGRRGAHCPTPVRAGGGGARRWARRRHPHPRSDERGTRRSWPTAWRTPSSPSGRHERAPDRGGAVGGWGVGGAGGGLLGRRPLPAPAGARYGRSGRPRGRRGITGGGDGNR